MIIERTLEVGKICLLVERGLVETERVDNVVDLLSTILDTLLSFLSRCVGTGVYFVLVLYSALRGEGYTH